MAYSPSYTYDPTSTDAILGPLSLVRLLIGDTNFSQVVTPPLSVMFADQELTVLLAKNQGDPVLTECDCLLTIANNRARLAAFVQLQGGGSVDLRGVARELREQEKEIRDRWMNTPAMAITEWSVSPFATRDILWNSIQRQEG